jgi:hypothetical protein
MDMMLLYCAANGDRWPPVFMLSENADDVPTRTESDRRAAWRREVESFMII